MVGTLSGAVVTENTRSAGQTIDAHRQLAISVADGGIIAAIAAADMLCEKDADHRLDAVGVSSLGQQRDLNLCRVDQTALVARQRQASGWQLRQLALERRGKFGGAELFRARCQAVR